MPPWGVGGEVVEAGPGSRCRIGTLSLGKASEGVEQACAHVCVCCDQTCVLKTSRWRQCGERIGQSPEWRPRGPGRGCGVDVGWRLWQGSEGFEGMGVTGLRGEEQGAPLRVLFS